MTLRSSSRPGGGGTVPSNWACERRTLHNRWVTREFGWVGSADTGAASWLAPYPYPYDTPVGAWLADRYPHVLQIMHPAYQWHGAHRDPTPVSWSQIAAARGTRLTPGMSFYAAGRLEGPNETVDGVFDMRPEAGSIPPEWIDAVYDHLDDAHMGLLWGGWGTFVDVEIRGAARVRDEAGWEYLVLSATRAIGEHTFVSRTPNFWWPEDHSWCAVCRHGHRRGRHPRGVHGSRAAGSDPRRPTDGDTAALSLTGLPAGQPS